MTRRLGMLVLLALAVPPLWLASVLAAPVMQRLYREIGLDTWERDA